MMRRSSRDEQQIEMRPYRDTVRDRSRGVPLTTPSPLTIKAMHIDFDDDDCDGGVGAAIGGDDID